MTHDVDEQTDWDDDDRYDDDRDRYEKTEPDCPVDFCYDTGFIPARVGRTRSRRCPACNPGWLRWRMRHARWRAEDLMRRFGLRRRRPPVGNFDDEAPF